MNMQNQLNALGGGSPPSVLINQFVQGLAGYSHNIQFDNSRGLSENDRDFLENKKIISRQILETSFEQAEQERIKQYAEFQAQQNINNPVVFQNQSDTIPIKINGESEKQVQQLSDNRHIEVSLNEETKGFFTNYFSEINNNLMTIIELLKEINRPEDDFEEFILGDYDEKEIDSKLKTEEE